MTPTRKRNAQGNGTVRQRENGTWEARCIINGKRKSFYGERQTDILKAMRAAQSAADGGVYFEPQRINLAKWLDLWLDEYVRSSAKPLTYSTYKSRVETHIKPTLGKIKLTNLNATQIQAFYNDLLHVQELSPKTIKNVHGILHKALDQALKLRYIGLNPADACTLPRIEKRKSSPSTSARSARSLPLLKTNRSEIFSRLRSLQECARARSAVFHGMR